MKRVKIQKVGTKHVTATCYDSIDGLLIGQRFQIPIGFFHIHPVKGQLYDVQLMHLTLSTEKLDASLVKLRATEYLI